MVTMANELRRAVVFTVVMMVLVGGAYHGLIWSIGRVAFRDQADGSLLRRADGTVVGSRLVAQSFTRDDYFHPRPSAVDYDAASAGGSNYGPSNPDHLRAVRERLAEVMKREGAAASQVPAEMVTMSGGGLDPHIPPEAAELQATRVARARGVEVARIRALVRAHTEGPQLGFLGRARINVLELNIALDDTFGARRREQ
jgi:potassium-transporting ATPase KdpC subunit